uniref:Uncharacterized protein n=1 Tax=Oryza nivara TaxID=4536 RepID=A0A0E0I3R9_ORYNI
MEYHFSYRVFDVFMKEKLSSIWDGYRGLLQTTVRTSVSLMNVSSYLECNTARGSCIFNIACILLHYLKLGVQVVVIAVLMCPLVVLYMFGIYISTALSLWRLARHRDYYSVAGEGDTNMTPALDVLYSLAIFQGVIFTYRVSYSSAAEAIVNDICRYYHMDARESVWDYLRDTMIGCEKDPSFARGRNMVTYAVEQVESSSSPDGYLSGLRILSTLVGEIASSYACSTTHVEQHRMIKHMLISRHHVVMLKLIQTLEPRGPHDAEARERAAVIVAYIAGGVHLERLPRALCCVTSLLDDEYRLAEPYDRDLVLEKLQLRPPPCPDEEVEFVEMYRLVYEREPPHLSLEKYKNLVVQGQRILGKLAADEDNCRIMSDTRGLVSTIMAPISSGSDHGGRPRRRLHDDHRYELSVMAKGSITLIGQLVSVPFQDSRVKLRRQITSCKPAISTMESILRCDGCDAELRRLAAQLLTVLSLDKSSGGMSSENIQGLIRILTDIFVHDSKRSSVRKCAGEELVKLSLESESNASIILKLKLNDSIVVDRLSEMVVDVEDNTFRTSAADILKHLCINHTTDDEHWDKLKNSMTIAIPKVLRELLGCDWRRPERQTVATQANNSGNFSPPDADIEALPDGDPSRVSNGGNNASSCSNQQNGKQYTPEEIEVQEALASLCVTVCDKLISTDPVLADRFDKIAADVCLDSSITANTTANTAFAALVKEAGEVVEKRKAQSIKGLRWDGMDGFALTVSAVWLLAVGAQQAVSVGVAEPVGVSGGEAAVGRGGEVASGFGRSGNRVAAVARGRGL